MDWVPFLSGMIGGLSGVATATGILVAVIRGWHQQLNDLRVKVEKHQEDRLTRAEHDIESVKQGCAPCRQTVERHEKLLDHINPGLTDREIGHLSAQLDRMDGKLDKQGEQLARLETHVSTLKEDVDRAHTKISAIRRVNGEIPR